MQQFIVVIPSTINIDDTIAKLKANCDEFSGNSDSGTFSGKGVKGSYVVDGQNINITLTDKPWIASWDYVQNKIKAYFNN